MTCSIFFQKIERLMAIFFLRMKIWIQLFRLNMYEPYVMVNIKIIKDSLRCVFTNGSKRKKVCMLAFILTTAVSLLNLKMLFIEYSICYRYAITFYPLTKTGLLPVAFGYFQWLQKRFSLVLEVGKYKQREKLLMRINQISFFYFCISLRFISISVISWLQHQMMNLKRFCSNISNLLNDLKTLVWT